MFKLFFKYCVWATCKAKASFSEQDFHSEVLLGDAPLKFNGQKSIPVSMGVNPPPFPTHHSSISLYFHRLHHATCNSPAFKSTLLSSWWSPQFTHWQTLHLSLVQRCGERSPRRVILAVRPLCTYYWQLCTFLCFWCALEHIQGKRERQHRFLTGCGSAQCFVPDISGKCGSLLPSVKIMWSWCIWWVILHTGRH